MSPALEGTRRCAGGPCRAEAVAGLSPQHAARRLRPARRALAVS